MASEIFIAGNQLSKYKCEEPFIVISKWMRGKDTIELENIWTVLQYAF